jgi:hypothetical protein
MAADCIDTDPVGKPTYRSVLPYLKDKDADAFIEMLKSENWEFIPDQWQVQMWAKIFRVIPQDQFIFYAPQIEKRDYGILPGVDGNRFVEPTGQDSDTHPQIQKFIETALKQTIQKMESEGRRRIKIAWLADGPYGIVCN